MLLQLNQLENRLQAGQHTLSPNKASGVRHCKLSARPVLCYRRWRSEPELQVTGVSPRQQRAAGAVALPAAPAVPGKAQQAHSTERGVSAAQAGRAAGLPLRFCSVLAGQVLEWKNSSVVRSACATQ